MLLAYFLSFLALRFRSCTDYKGSGAIYLKRNHLQGDKISFQTLNKLTQLQCVHVCIKNKRCSSISFEKKDRFLGECGLQEKSETDEIQRHIYDKDVRSIYNQETVYFESFSFSKNDVFICFY